MLYSFAVCTALIFLAFTPPARAQGNAAFMLHALSVVTHAGQTQLELAISVRNAAVLQAALREGAALNLEFGLDLEKLRRLVPNKTVDKHSLLYQIRFDPLTREYLLLREGQPAYRNRGLQALLEMVLEDAAIPLAPPAVLENGARYRLNLTLSVRYADVPPWLEKTLFFWSWDVITPTTFMLDFVHEGDLPHPAPQHGEGHV